MFRYIIIIIYEVPTQIFPMMPLGRIAGSREREQGYSGGSELFFVMGFVRRTCKLSVFALIRLFPLWEQPQNVIT